VAKDEDASPANELARRRASERLRAIAQLAVQQGVQKVVNKETVRAAFATKLVAIGLTLLCFAGGADYFSHGDEVHAAIAGLARAEGQGAMVDRWDAVGGVLDAWQRAALSLVPTSRTEALATAALVAGLAALAWGIKLKLGGNSEAERGRTLWDLGVMILGPGLVGAAAHLVVTVQGFPVLRRTTAGFVAKVREGGLSAGDVASLAVHYHAWTWARVGPVLVLGLLVPAAAIAAGRVPKLRGRTPVDVGRRAGLVFGTLALTYYACVTAVAVASYGAGLPVVTWPWLVRPGMFLLTLGLMGLGGGVAWTGLALLRRARITASAGAAPP
jgi:hypothetical protein